MMPRAVLLDSGDTLVDEGTEIKDDDGITLRAELVPGARELVVELHRRGFALGLVADGPAQSFRNVLGRHRLFELFDAHAFSSEVGVTKPDARMFLRALDAMGVVREEYAQTLMVGNHLSRDVAGANALGLCSVWIDWAPRRSKVPAAALEIPRHTIRAPVELLGLLDGLGQDA